MPTRTIVRCSQGALCATIWWPGASLKALRLGTARLQRCPVHHKWERTRRVDPASLTEEEAATARSVHDVGVP